MYNVQTKTKKQYVYNLCLSTRTPSYILLTLLEIMQESYSVKNVFVYLIINLFAYNTWAELLTILSPGRFVVEVELFPSLHLYPFANFNNPPWSFPIRVAL